MRYILIHQNFPGQFRHLAKVLADDPANEVVGIGAASSLKGRSSLHPRVRVLTYNPHGAGSKNTHHYLRDFEGHVRRGQSVVRLLLTLRDEAGFHPDVVVAHPGWGEGLFLKDVFPGAKVIQYCEYYYQNKESDIGFDAEFPSTLDDLFRIRIKNSTQLHSLIDCDMGISPTGWQRSRYPAEFQNKIAVVHEGINTDIVKPDAAAWIEVNKSLRLRAGEEIVTYVARNLEPYRGIHTFIRSLPYLQAQRPNARVIIVGGDDVSYGRRLPQGQTYRKHYCSEVQNQVNWQNVHFVGKLPYADYLKVLQVSAAHVYLTYPFVLSWSMLEAMAAGCLVIASDTAPVKEVIGDQLNGLLVEFFDPEGLASKVTEVLADPMRYRPLRDQARRTVVERYDLKTICLPRMLDIVQQQTECEHLNARTRRTH